MVGPVAFVVVLAIVFGAFVVVLAIVFGVFVVVFVGVLFGPAVVVVALVIAIVSGVVGGSLDNETRGVVHSTTHDCVSYPIPVSIIKIVLQY